MAGDLIVAVTGPSGRLGSELVRQGCRPITANVAEFAALGQQLRDINPDVVIHCAAMTNVDMCELAPITAGQTNTGGTYTLGQVFRGPIVYLSTDYVFDGEAGPYDECAKPNPISIYGWSKLGGELVIKNRQNPGDLIVRTTILFDAYTNNFVTAVIERLKASQTVHLPDALYGSPTYVPYLAGAILQAVRQKVTGIINIAGSQVVSRFELGRLIATLMDMSPSRIEAGPVVGTAPRPLRAGLTMEHAASLGLPVGDLVEQLQETINALETVGAGPAGNN